MSSGAVVGTISTTTCAPRACSKAASLASSAWRCAASSVPVLSITRAVRAGTGSTSCAHVVRALNSRPAASNRPGIARVAEATAARPGRQNKGRDTTGKALGRLFLVEVHGRRGRDLCLVLHAEGGFDRVAEHHGRQVVREAAR